MDALMFSELRPTSASPRPLDPPLIKSTSISSSVWFDRGFVTYSNEAKTEMISVPALVIDQYGAVSEPVVNAMVTGALKHSAADYAIAVTGVAGPGGGSAENPVGTVWIGVGSKHQLVARKYIFPGDRDAVRQATLETALENLQAMLKAGDDFGVGG